MQRLEKSLAELKKVVVRRPQVLINVPLGNVNGVDLSPQSPLQQAALAVEKDFAGSGRVLLRASGTEPVVRVMVEGNDPEVVKRTAESLAEMVMSISKNQG